MNDGRLLLPAGAAWAGAAVTVLLLGLVGDATARHPAGLAVCAGALVTAAATLAIAAVGRWPRPQQRRWLRAGVAVPLCAGALGVLVAGWQVAALSAPPLGGWIQTRATAIVTGVVSGEPVVRRSTRAALWQAPARQEVRLATSSVSARGTDLLVDVPLVVLLPIDAGVPPPGATVRMTGRLGGAGAASGAAASLTVAGRGEGVVVLAGPGWVDAWAHDMRIGLRSALASVPADAGALVAGLSVGDESLQTDELADAMQASGLSHLTAVSGGNVAVIVVVVLGIAGVLRVSLLWRVLASLAALAFFVVLVGAQPSVLRAAVMGSVVLVGMLVGGRRAGSSVLATSVLLLVVLSPTLAASWGFALSVFATAGLILLSARLAAGIAAWHVTRRWPPAVREGLAITGAAQVATLPLLVAMGAGVGWVAVPANLLAMPLVGWVTVLGLGTALIAPVSPGLAAIAAQAAAPPAGWIAGVARVGSDLPLARMPWPQGWWGAVLLAVVVAGGVLVRRAAMRRFPEGTPRRMTGAATAVVALVVGLWLVAPPDRRAWPPEGWFLIMCDVGQGDALLLRASPTAAVVVDAGPDPDAVDRCLDDARVRSVSALVLTHFHADHVNGTLGVFRDRDVAQVLANPIRDPVEQATDVDRWLDGVHQPAGEVSAGDRRRIGDVEWQVLWPRRVIASGSIPNNASVVLAVTVAGRSVLLSGDIEPEAQAAVAAELASRRFDVVKVPHHGSRYQHPLLTSWAPAPIALISAGDGNTYGHPAAETIADWAGHGALVARTDRDGDVAVVAVDSGVGVVARHGMLPSS